MKQYPSIEKNINNKVKIWAFDKIDGSNIRAEWNLKKGFYKFGSKTQLIGETEFPLGESISLIKNKYEEDLSNIFSKKRFENVICFFEFYGKNSFAGSHKKEIHDVILFDINPYKQGILHPIEYLKLVSHLNVSLPIYEGFADFEFVTKVRENKLPGISFEGVVCKGKADNKTKMPIMFKIKTNIWLATLKEICGNNIQLYSELE